VNWPIFQETVTVADVLEAGACFEGVARWVLAHAGQIAGPTGKNLHVEFVEQGSCANGYGNGNGNGNGYGNGYGNGDGYGYGYGYGDGYGNGYGDGDGYGNGYGYGYGNGYGDGDGGFS